MSLAIQKETAHKMIDELKSGATWDDLMQEFLVR